jgi:hypothetical protein
MRLLESAMTAIEEHGTPYFFSFDFDRLQLKRNEVGP